MTIEVNQVSNGYVKPTDDSVQVPLEPGQIIEGEIVEKSSTTTKVRIQQQIHTMPVGVTIDEAEGEKAKFSVKSVKEDSLVLKYLPKNPGASKAADIMLPKMQRAKVDGGFEVKVKEAMASISVESDIQLEQTAKALRNTLEQIMDTVTDEDVKAIVKDHYDIEKITVDMFKALVDQNKIAIKLGDTKKLEADVLSKVKSFSDDFSQKFGSTDILKEIVATLQEEKQPITLKQVEKIGKAVEQYKIAMDLSDDQILNVLRNNKSFTLEEVIKVSHLPAQNVSVSADVESLKPQITQLLNQNNIEVTDRHVSLALKAIAANMPLDESTINKLDTLVRTTDQLVDSSEITAVIKHSISNLSEKISATRIPLPLVIQEQTLADVDIPKYIQNVHDIKDNDLITAIDRGLTISVDNLNQVSVDSVQVTTKWSDISMVVEKVMTEVNTFEMEESVELTLKALNGKAESIVEQSGELKFIKSKIAIEELRLKMTFEAAHRLGDKGINIETESIETLVEALKVEEREQYSRALEVHQVPVTKEHLDTMEMTMTATKRMVQVEEQILSEVLASKRTFTMESITINTEDMVLRDVLSLDDPKVLDQAMSRYETMETAIRPDLGDRVEKAFTHLPDMLESLDIEVSDENLRIAKALGKSEVPITKETIEQIKVMDQKVSLVAESLKPNIVASMIKEQVSPLQMPVDDLINYVESYGDAFLVDDSETIAEAIWALGKTGQLSEAENDSLLGIYRMLKTVSNAKGAATSFLVKKELPLTINNLFEAAKYIKSTHVRMTKVEATIDDDFGMLKAMAYDGTKVSDQVDRALKDHQLPMNLREANLLSELEAGEVDLTRTNITRAESHMTAMDRFFNQFDHEKMMILEENGHLQDLEKPLSEITELLKNMDGQEGNKTATKEVIDRFAEMVKMDISILKTFQAYGMKPSASQLMTHFTLQENPHEMETVFNDLFGRLEQAGMDSGPLRNALLQLSDSALGDEYESILKNIQDELKVVSELTGDQPQGQDLQKDANQSMQLIEYQQQLFKEEDYYQIPVWIDNQWTQLNLFYQNHSSNAEAKAEDEMDIYLYFETKTMGKVQSHMHLQDKQMQFSIYSEHAEDRERIMGYQEEITSLLGESIFDVDEISYEKIDSKSPVDKPIEQADNKTMRYVDSKFVANA